MKSQTLQRRRTRKGRTISLTASPSKKYSESRRFWQKTEVSHEEKPIWMRAGRERARDLGLLIGHITRPAIDPQTGLIFVGYLGFCAGIFLLERTIPESSAREARGGAEAAPFRSEPLRGSLAVRLGRGSGYSSRPSCKKGRALARRKRRARPPQCGNLS